MKYIEEILRYFPNEIHIMISKIIEQNNYIGENLEEIRLRVQKPIILKLRNKDIVIQNIINQMQMLQVLERLCENSIYAYKNQLCDGFVTIKGGHRVGITGTVVVENNKIINIKYVTSINVRIARQVFGSSDKILKEVVDLENNNIFNTLIVSPPGKGKTTILRDLIRNISNGIEKIGFNGKTVGVVDERGEIAAMYRGVPQNDVGIRTDIIENVSKAKGMNMLIRSMAPEIIASDEIGSAEDAKAIEYALHSGVKGIFTMHGNDLEDIKENKEIYRLVENKKIEKIIFI